MVLTAYFVLSPATNSSCHRHRRIKVLSDPVGPTCLRKLDTSNGCQDHTTSPSAACAVRQHAVDRSRETRPAITSRAQRCRVHRIPPRVRDDRDTPLMWGGTAGDIDLIWVKREGEYFCEGDWTGGITLIPQQIFLPLSFRGAPAGRARRGPMTGSARTRNPRIPRGAIAPLRSGPSDHPGMTAYSISTEARNSSAFSLVGKRPTSR
jgi:hypothetical protein